LKETGFAASSTIRNDVSSAARLKLTVAEMDRALGLENVRVIHANDSKTPPGSHVDRHEHIGRGYIGEDGFRRILNQPKLRTKAFIIETQWMKKATR